VFPLRDEDVACDPVPIARHWPRINGLDFGWDHPFAAAACAWDRDADIWYVTATYRAKQTTPVIHAAAIKPWGGWIPWAWPHDGLQHDNGSGKQLAALYREQGLELLAEYATHEAEGSAQHGPGGTTGGTGVEAGVIEMLDRMQTGRLKVFRHLAEWFSEFRLYHRDDGRIVKEHDDLICATRYALMMKRFAVTEPGDVKIKISAGGGWAAR
jgi:hypothetical protein